MALSKEEELSMKFQQFERQLSQLQEQLHVVEEGIADLHTLHTGLDDLREANQREVLAPLGRGIFAPARVTDTTLYVDIGSRLFIRATPETTKGLISDQLEKLDQVKQELNEAAQEVNAALTETMRSAYVAEESSPEEKT